MTTRRGARAQRVLPGEYGRGNRRHGLATAVIQGMVARQEGRCAVCLDPLPAVPFVDHDHALASQHGHDPSRGCPYCVRALVCGHCNSMLGFARDDPARLEAAVAYLAAWARGHPS